ncbi:hypothetical protein VNI00_014889 [Paramarasmius palmivorus]|uniref:Uncharacterized protein n=1 Tax=Paramarasmius palmivorus TaxID=297713 RepID=A0AAW0BPU5_9AGAR
MSRMRRRRRHCWCRPSARNGLVVPLRNRCRNRNHKIQRRLRRRRRVLVTAQAEYSSNIRQDYESEESESESEPEILVMEQYSDEEDVLGFEDYGDSSSDSLSEAGSYSGEFLVSDNPSSVDDDMEFDTSDMVETESFDTDSDYDDVELCLNVMSDRNSNAGN